MHYLKEPERFERDRLVEERVQVLQEVQCLLEEMKQCHWTLRVIESAKNIGDVRNSPNEVARDCFVGLLQVIGNKISHWLLEVNNDPQKKSKMPFPHQNSYLFLSNAGDILKAYLGFGEEVTLAEVEESIFQALQRARDRHNQLIEPLGRSFLDAVSGCLNILAVDSNRDDEEWIFLNEEAKALLEMVDYCNGYGSYSRFHRLVGSEAEAYEQLKNVGLEFMVHRFTKFKITDGERSQEIFYFWRYDIRRGDFFYREVPECELLAAAGEGF